MSSFLEFAVLGLGLGGLYSLLSLGLVLIYRGSGVLNLAQGGFAYFGATMYYTLQSDAHLSSAVSAIISIALGALVGVAVSQLIMRPMRGASYLTRLVATLGLMIFIEDTIDWRISGNFYLVKGLLPTWPVHFSEGISVGADRLIILGMAVVLTVILHYVYSRTKFGLVTSAVAANERAVASLGYSPGAVATANWAIGSALGAATGVFLVPISGVVPNSMSLLIVPALACAVIGGFRSFSYVLFAALAVGIAQSEFAFYFPSIEGLSYALPFAFIIVIPFIRGQALPGRGGGLDRLPMVGGGGFKWQLVLPLVVAVGAASYFLNATWQTAFSLSCVGVVLALSVVVVTGFAGQVSLAQFVLAGIAAWVTGQATIDVGLPFWAALVVGPLVTIPIGLLIGIPALRARGVSLAVATLGFAVLVENMLFANGTLTGGISGTDVGEIHLFGLDIYPVSYPWRYGIVCLVLATASGFVVATLRRSPTGRRLLAVRSNERAAASLGIGIGQTKFYAFGVSAALAGLGGVLWAFEEPDITYTGFTSVASITLVLFVVLAGVGFASGGLLSGLMYTGGLVGQVAIEIFHSGQEYQAIASLVLLVSIVFNPDGLVKVQMEQYEWLRRRMAAMLPGRRTATPLDERATMSVETLIGDAMRDRKDEYGPGLPLTSGFKPDGAASGTPILEVEGLTVRFGGIAAISDLTFSIRPSEVVGLIGANGAGKTTVIDSISGFVGQMEGVIRLRGSDISSQGPTARARSGIRRTFQSLELFEDISVAENISVASETPSIISYLRDLVAPPPAGRTTAAEEAIEQFGLSDDLAVRPSELSYGARRVAAIVRALAVPGAVLLLDEPTAGLDVRDSRQLGRLVKEFSSRTGTGVLLVEHDVELVMAVCDRVIALDFGRKIAEGNPREILASRAVQEAYLGIGSSEAHVTTIQVAPDLSGGVV